MLVYVVLLPRIALPCNDTRALFAAVDVVRLRTLRDGFVVVRATTLRDEFVFAAVVRDVVVRAATLRALFAVFVAVVVASRRELTPALNKQKMPPPTRTQFPWHFCRNLRRYGLS